MFIVSLYGGCYCFGREFWFDFDLDCVVFDLDNVGVSCVVRKKWDA